MAWGTLAPPASMHVIKLTHLASLESKVLYLKKSPDLIFATHALFLFLIYQLGLLVELKAAFCV